MSRDCKMQNAKCKMQIGGTAATPRGQIRIRISSFYILHFAICILQSFCLCRSLRRSIAFILALTLGTIAYSAENATPANPDRLIDRTPFDQVTLDQESGGKTLEVMPLDLPQRPLAVVPQEGTLRLRLLEQPIDVFEVAWPNVARVRVFEELLLAEAIRLTAAGRYDEAYDYFARLSAEHPSLPGLSAAISEYLRQNALALYQGGERDRALALLITLHQHDPRFAGLAGAVQTVAGEIIQRYLRDGDYLAARGVLDLWQTQFPELVTSATADWQRRFEAAATRQLDEARRLLGEREYIAARRSVGRALAIWPKLTAAAEVDAQIKREFPFLTVGVFETAPRQPMQSIDNWAALRTTRLVEPLLVEQTGFDADGGNYRSPFGELMLDDTGLELSFALEPAHDPAAAQPFAATPDALSRYLLSLADRRSAHYRSDFADLLGGVSIAADRRVTLHFKRAHVRPEGLLACPWGTPRFAIAEHTPDQVIFTATASSPHATPAIRSIVEETMADEEAAVHALTAGEIEVLDRVPPWLLEQLRAAQAVRVEPYRLPTVHVLIPNFARPLPARREFRRALCYGIDRKWIVDRVLLGGAPQPGFEVLSGPFPMGVSLSDPLRYGYNNQVLPRSFEPRLAAILATIAWAGARPSNDKESAEPTPIPELVLAHPGDPVARIACQSIETQLERAGIPIRLQELTADELVADRRDWDIRYAELAVWEPVTDARRILGPRGIAGDAAGPYIDSALRELDEATNWQDVRTRLSVLHEIAHHELPVVPLWQTVNHFAYRTSLQGMGEAPITLYQNVERWQSASSGSVAQLKRGE
jgi:tetratricopeptide (TPR) repeat protein